MLSLPGRLRRKLRDLRERAALRRALPPWARGLFASALTPQLRSEAGETLVWCIRNDASSASVTDQFTANAEEYNRRYAASEHFEALFRQALEGTGVKIATAPRILDLGSGSGVNSVVPCRRLCPGARVVATDLSAELLAMLSGYLAEVGARDEVVCVKMDAMANHVAPGAFDLVTGASILHHLDSPAQGIAAAGRALKRGGHAIFFEPFNGWAIIRLAFERILAEADLRGTPLDPDADDALRRLIADTAARSRWDRTPAEIANLDDKWLFSRTVIEKMAQAAGFSQVRFVPHNDHPSLYRDSTIVYLRLQSGGDDLALPDWAMEILDGFDAALTLQAKRELMMEGTIVLTKG